MAELKNIHLKPAMLGMSRAVSERMRSNAPVDTGRLQKSIKVGKAIETPKGISEPISFLEYGIFTDQGTKFIPAQNWIGRSIDEVINEQMKRVADAAAHDVADYIGDVLPDNIDITLKV